MMSGQEGFVPPVKKGTGCGAVVRAFFSWQQSNLKKDFFPNCTDKDFEGRQSFATCQKGETSCSVVVMVAVGLLLTTYCLSTCQSPLS